MKNERRRRNAGFTLLELIIALSISSIVLIGSFSVLTSMVQYEVEGMRRGSINGWSLAGLVAMNREIESANALVYPIAGGSANSMSVCTNYSRIKGGSLDGGASRTYSYCWDSGVNVLRRMTAAGCPGLGTAPAGCGAGWGADSVVATGVYLDSFSDPVFATDASGGTIRLRYIIGKPTIGAAINEGNGMTNFATPQSMTFDTRLTMEKAVGGANVQD